MKGRGLTPAQEAVLRDVRTRAHHLREPKRTEREVRAALIMEGWPRAAIEHVMAEGST